MNKRKTRERYQSKSQDSSFLSKASTNQIPPLGNIEGLRSKFKVFLSPKFIPQSTMNLNKENAFVSPQHSKTTPNSPKLIHLKKPENTTKPVMIKIKKTKPLDETTILRKRLATPVRLEKINFSDEKSSPIRGENASQNFYQKFRILDKIQEVNSLYGVKNDATTSFLVKTQSLQLLPSKIGFINERTDLDVLKAK